MSDQLFENILNQLSAYKKKYYLNTLIKGSLVSIAVLLTAYLFFVSLEQIGHFNTGVRLAFLLTFAGLTSFAIGKWVVIPSLHLMALRKQITNEEAARQIGRYFPEVDDKLLNALQLRALSTRENELLAASIQQKTRELSVVPFTKAVDLGQNRKYLRYAAPPVLVILFLLIFIPQFITESTARIVNYNEAYAPKAPFAFVLGNEKLEAFKNENFEVQLRMEGGQLPEQVYLIHKGKRNKMRKGDKSNSYVFVFNNIQHSEDFSFEAAGFNSATFHVNVIARPDLRAFDSYLEYPAYLNKKNESLQNAGNLSVPEGTKVTWQFTTADADKIALTFSGDRKAQILESASNLFRFTRKMLNTESYQLQLQNGQVQNKEAIQYSVNVIKDQLPAISVESFSDTVLYNRVSLGGKISDDYGLRHLQLHYRQVSKDKPSETVPFVSKSISIDTRSSSQSFYYDWKLDSVALKPGQKLEYYLQVWDNDGVNGSKSAKTRVFEFNVPGSDQIQESLTEATKAAENKMEDLVSKSLQLQKEINQAQQKIRSKQSLTWQDHKSLKDMLKKHEELRENLNELNKETEKLLEKQEKFNPQSEELLKKMEELQKLMDELLDEETKKLYEQLQKLLEEKADKDMIDKLLEQMEKKDEQLGSEIDRALEQMKQLEFDQKLEKAIEDLKELAEKQEQLAEKTQKGQEDPQKLKEEQKQNAEEFKKIQQDIQDLKKLNEGLENKKDLQNTESEEQEINKEMQEGEQQLNEGQKNKAGKSQKEAAEKMKQMAQKMQQNQSNMQMEEMQENLDDLRDILENLITLSFDQEALMKDFRQVHQSDPRFLQLGQKQMKLRDDSKIIEDSLMALAKRVFQIRSYVTREVTAMKGHMEESIEAIRDRRVDIATGKQQFTMTSINNLALMLDEVLRSMQEQMNQQSNASGSGSCKKPGKSNPNGNGQPKPGGMDLGKMQEMLNKRLEDMKNGKLGGKQMSDELARMAAQQELIRRALKQLEGKQKPGGSGIGNQMSELKKLMEQTEKDLVNKNITRETLLRQQEILTRLLESEKAARERGMEEKREAEQAKDKEATVPPSLEKYLKAKEKQVDLLKTLPPVFTPYYKQEVNEYFQKLEK